MSDRETAEKIVAEWRRDHLWSDNTVTKSGPEALRKAIAAAIRARSNPNEGK